MIHGKHFPEMQNRSDIVEFHGVFFFVFFAQRICDLSSFRVDGRLFVLASLLFSKMEKTLGFSFFFHTQRFRGPLLPALPAGPSDASFCRIGALFFLVSKNLFSFLFSLLQMKATLFDLVPTLFAETPLTKLQTRKKMIPSSDFPFFSPTKTGSLICTHFSFSLPASSLSAFSAKCTLCTRFPTSCIRILCTFRALGSIQWR